MTLAIITIITASHKKAMDGRRFNIGNLALSLLVNFIVPNYWGSMLNTDIFQQVLSNIVIIILYF